MNTGTHANTHTSTKSESERKIKSKRERQELNAQTNRNVMNIIYLHSGLHSVWCSTANVCKVANDKTPLDIIVFSIQLQSVLHTADTSHKNQLAREMIRSQNIKSKMLQSVWHAVIFRWARCYHSVPTYHSTNLQINPFRRYKIGLYLMSILIHIMFHHCQSSQHAERQNSFQCCFPNVIDLARFYYRSRRLPFYIHCQYV